LPAWTRSGRWITCTRSRWAAGSCPCSPRRPRSRPRSAASRASRTSTTSTAGARPRRRCGSFPSPGSGARSGSRRSRHPLAEERPVAGTIVRRPPTLTHRRQLHFPRHGHYDGLAMNSWLNFSILWMLTGSPVAAAVILIAAYAIADWYTCGFLRGVAQAVAAFRRGRRLRLVLQHNPHDRKARADLGAILVSQRRYARAIEVVKPLADEDPHDLPALYLLGVACLATGRIEQGELFLSEIHKADPKFKDGESLLEMGRWRARRRSKGAIEPLAEFLKAHPHH